MLTARALHHAYGNWQVLNGVDFDLARGEVLGLGGASGSGKTTLCRILAGQFTPDHGEVLLDGAKFKLARPGLPGPVQYAPQSPELAVDPRWTVGRILANATAPDPEVLTTLGIREAWTNRRPPQLSGGELARVSLSRLFHPGLRVLICDEITAQLDAIEQESLLRALIDLAGRREVALLLVSHSSSLRSRFCGKSVELGFQGKKVVQGKAAFRA
ncbi:ATP-binding cassette domain-containing protein [uncultured Maritimibacter sp.]|jgi:ABC-type dipeptide/oligopeptide/nickel transport system ATPase subunit|uniref:ATP-binding cassette domain-containing protein n=1 Tax=uncultured Maritimibacter sp. TaxID=991866 RepID=UPI000AE59FDE|nr:ATP-binding cassette domain-containing protein [uncultured Maritimibacter sp.]